jgi:transcriptional regulator GlxA family with amidase domain
MSIMRGKTATRPTVATVIGNGMSPFEFAVACEVFGYDRSELGVPWYRFLVCAAEPPPIRTEVGFTIDTPHRLDALARADTIIIPPLPSNPAPTPELLSALRSAHRRGARLMSVCTGAFVLAAAGLLDGRRATTHWGHIEEFSRRFPDVQLDPAVLYVDDGDILTSAGTAASIDLCLYVVRQDFGAEIANAVARRMVVPPHRDGGQSQFVEAPLPEAGDDALFAETLVWAQSHLDEPITVEDLARRSAMSTRTFARRFRNTAGTSPYRWLLRQRVTLAQRLLETTDLPVDIIAVRCGMGVAANLREHFQRVVGTSPAVYRRTFCHEWAEPPQLPA